METFALLDSVLYCFRDLFGSQNFLLFCAYVWGVITCTGRHTVSGIYQASASDTQYWSFPKFLSRGKWDWQQVCQRLIGVILSYLPQWVYVYDHTHAVKTGEKQFGLHFFRNHRYRKGNTNQSKFHWGHEFAALGILGLTGAGVFLFPVWVKLLEPGAESALQAFESVIALLPPGLIIFDRGFNNRKYFKALLVRGHHLLCRARRNAAFYYLPAPSNKKRRGKKRIYGKKVHIPKWHYEDISIEALGKTMSVAHQMVRTKMCPDPVRLVVVRTRPKKNKPYHYFLVYTTDLTLSVETIIHYYDLRWTFETGIRDSKESFGFDHYQVRSETSIQRSVVLSFLSASLTQLMALPQFQQQHPEELPELEIGLKQMNIHWYHPKRWTLGLIARYIRWKKSRQLFSASFSVDKNTMKNEKPYFVAAG
jgi:hypothetical protein